MPDSWKKRAGSKKDKQKKRREKKKREGNVVHADAMTPFWGFCRSAFAVSPRGQPLASLTACSGGKGGGWLCRMGSPDSDHVRLQTY